MRSSRQVMFGRLVSGNKKFFSFLIMKLFLFVETPATEEDKYVHDAFDEAYFLLVDAVHKRDKAWLMRNFDGQKHMCFYREYPTPYSAGWEFDTIEKLGEGDYPTLIVSFQDNDVIEEEEWSFINQYIQSLLHGCKVDNSLFEKAEKFMSRCMKEKVMQKPQLTSFDMEEDPKEEPVKAYSYRCEVNTAWDVCLVEIVKPYTDHPYTVVLRDFTRDGYLRLFTSIFICQSWGVSRDDHLFLKELWVRLGMEGECDLEKMLKEHTELCFPGEGRAPISEPEVYRHTLEEVIRILKKKKQVMFDIVEQGDAKRIKQD